MGYLLRLVSLFGIYFVTARIGLTIDAVSGFAALVWPPAGIALAGIVILGYRFWPAITLGALTVNFVTGAPLLVAAGIGIGNTLEALVGAYGLKRIIGFQNSLERVKDVMGLVVLAAILSTMVSATIGVASLWLGGIVSAAAFESTWIAWWVGDMLGIVVVAPLLLTWSVPAGKFFPRLTIEVLGFAALLIGVSILVFQGFPGIGVQPFTFVYVLFPIFIGIALRFGQRGSVLAAFIVSFIAVWKAVADYNGSRGDTLSQDLLLLQSFMGVTAVTFMVMAAVVAEREQTRKHQQELIYRTTALAKQRTRLTALNQVKDEFIALASHQLRTPASGVKQYIGMLLENYAGKLTKDQRQLAQLAYDCNERQIYVVDDLLNVAQIDAGKVTLNMEKVNLKKLIEDVLDEQDSAFASRHQTLTFVSDRGRFIVSADKAKLRMVLENVISNASKYTAEYKKVGVILRKTRNYVEVSVKDEGIGITKRDLSKLFKKFSRVDNSQSINVDGTGLGLYWAKRLIDLHHGSITVTSKPDHGSTFTIALPTSKHSI